MYISSSSIYIHCRTDIQQTELEIDCEVPSQAKDVMRTYTTKIVFNP